ncbi:MAG TPA: hypothetical protein VHT05_07260 [Candidatus Elarobacter sp.]|nr:hypothetical protein [Candidatus Elarobacter sp.]
MAPSFSRGLFGAFVLAVTCVVAGCGGGSTTQPATPPATGSTPTPTPSPTLPAKTTASVVVGASPVTATLGPIASGISGVGVSGTVTFPATTGGTATFSMVFSTSPSPAPAVQNRLRRALDVCTSCQITGVAYLSVSSSANASFLTTPTFTFYFLEPVPAGTQAYIAFCPTACQSGEWAAELGPVTIGGSTTTATFPNANLPTSFTAPGPSFIALFTATGSVLTPGPTPTATPTAKPTATPTPGVTPTPTPTPNPSSLSCAAKPTSKHLYVVLDEGLTAGGSSSIPLNSYALPLTSSSTPTALQNISPGGAYMTFDPSCNLYLTEYTGVVNEYASPFTGSPIASYTGAETKNPNAVVINSSGDVFIAENGTGQVLELSSLTGTVVNTISGLNAPAGLALDAAQNLYVGTQNNVTIYAPPYKTAKQTITQLQGVVGLAVDSKNDIFASNGTGSITVLAPPYGTTNTIATITTGVFSALGLALDSNGNLYVANYAQNDSNVNTLTAYAPPYTGAPFATLSGYLPEAVAVGP